MKDFCVTWMKTAYTLLYLSQDTNNETALQVNCYQVSWITGKEKVHVYTENVSLVGREGKGCGGISPEPWWYQRSTLGEVHFENFILLSCSLVLKSEDQTLFNISGK